LIRYRVDSIDICLCYQANILIDSERCARLADFGLAVVIDESITGSAAVSRAARGTIRYMAPELFDPDTFGFTSGFLKLLPSMRTDIYALGMTILEVSACLYRLKHQTHLLVGYNWVPSIQHLPPPLHCHVQSRQWESARKTILRVL